MNEQLPVAALGKPIETETHKATVTHCGNEEYEITIIYQGRDLVRSSRFSGLGPLFAEARRLIENPPKSLDTKLRRQEDITTVVRGADGEVKS